MTTYDGYGVASVIDPQGEYQSVWFDEYGVWLDDPMEGGYISTIPGLLPRGWRFATASGRC